MSWEFAILDGIQNIFQSSVMDTMMPLITHLCDGGIFWILLALVFLMIPKTRRVGCFIVAALLVDVLLVNMLVKPLVNRIRPYEINTMVTLLINKPIDSSFPSGHTAASFAATAGLFMAGRKNWGIAALVLSGVIAFSRLYLYVHFPTDVLGGICFGVLSGVLGGLLIKLIEKQREKKNRA